MNEWFDDAARLQKRMLDAQRSAIDLGKTSLSNADKMMAAQDASRKAVEANVAAWSAWMNLWGIGT